MPCNAAGTTAPAEPAAEAPPEGLELSPSPDGHGLVIESVAPDSPAAAAGLAAGDVIVSVNRKDVATLDEFKSAMDAGEGPVLLFVEREGSGHFVLIG